MNDSVHIIDTLGDSGTVMIKLSGVLDEVSSLSLEEVLSKMSIKDEQLIIVDMQKVSEVKPEGVRVLLNAFIEYGDKSLQLKKPTTEVRQLLTTVGLESLLSD